MECWNCEQLTDAYLAANPHKKGRAICDECVNEMQENGFVFLELPYQPEKTNCENSITLLKVEVDDRFIHKTVRSGNLIMRYSHDIED